MRQPPGILTAIISFRNALYRVVMHSWFHEKLKRLRAIMDSFDRAALRCGPSS